MIRAQTGPDHTLVAEAACHDARTLTEGGNIAYILLDGQTYTLRITPRPALPRQPCGKRSTTLRPLLV